MQNLELVSAYKPGEVGAPSSLLVRGKGSGGLSVEAHLVLFAPLSRGSGNVSGLHSGVLQALSLPGTCTLGTAGRHCPTPPLVWCKLAQGLMCTPKLQTAPNNYKTALSYTARGCMKHSTVTTKLRWCRSTHCF